MTTILNNDVLSVLSKFITPYTKNKQLQIYVNKKNKIIIKGYGFSERKKIILEILKENNDHVRNSFYSWEKKIHWFTADDIQRSIDYKYDDDPRYSWSRAVIRNDLRQMEDIHVSRAVYGRIGFWNDFIGRNYWFLVEKGQRCLSTTNSMEKIDEIRDKIRKAFQ